MPLSLTLLTPPRQEPVTLGQMKAHLRVSLDDENDLILGYIQAARQYLEEATARQFLSAVWVLGLDGWPCDGGPYGAGIRLPRPPLLSLTPTVAYPTLGITYLDSAGVSQPLASTVYRVDTLSQPGRIALLPSQSWPGVYSVSNAVQITYLAGYANPGRVPASLKQAIVLLAAHWYEHREAITETTLRGGLVPIPLGVESLLWLNRLVEVA